MVGDGHTMGVASQVLQHVFGTTKGTASSRPPSLAGAGLQPGSEDLGLRKELQVSVEVELAILESLLKSVDELAAKNFTQHFLGKKVVIS